MQQPTYTEQFFVRRFEIDRNTKLLLQALCMAMGEAAGNHALKLGFGTEQLSEHDLTWVLVKMRIVMEDMPKMRETFTLETWPTTVERLQFRRDFIMRDGSNNIFVRAVTQWVIMNTKTRRLDKIPDAFVKLRPDAPNYALEDGNIRIGTVENGFAGSEFRIRLSDMDHLEHVNNTKYIDFALETAHGYAQNNPDFQNKTLQQLDVNFRAEAVYGDTVLSETAEEAGVENTLLHSLKRSGTGQELARLRTVWK